MGCMFCKDRSQAEDPDRVDERSRLLDNDYAKTPIRPIRDDGSPNSMTSGNKTDEQSLLSRILHKTAQNIIDVSAIEPHSMERSEYMDKMRHYLEKTSNSDYHFNKSKATLGSVTHAPMNVLLADTTSPEDIKLITDASISIAACISQIHITCEESLVESIGVEKAMTPTT